MELVLSTIIIRHNVYSNITRYKNKKVLDNRLKI